MLQIINGSEMYLSYILKIVAQTTGLQFRSSRPEVFCKEGVLRNFSKFTGKHLCQSLFFNKVAGQACDFIKKETLAKLFSCEFCEVSKSTFFTEHLPVTASNKCKVSSNLGDYPKVLPNIDLYWI